MTQEHIQDCAKTGEIQERESQAGDDLVETSSQTEKAARGPLNARKEEEIKRGDGFKKSRKKASCHSSDSDTGSSDNAEGPERTSRGEVKVSKEKLRNSDEPMKRSFKERPVEIMPPPRYTSQILPSAPPFDP